MKKDGLAIRVVAHPPLPIQGFSKDIRCVWATTPAWYIEYLWAITPFANIEHIKRDERRPPLEIFGCSRPLDNSRISRHYFINRLGGSLDYRLYGDILATIRPVKWIIYRLIGDISLCITKTSIDYKKLGLLGDSDARTRIVLYGEVRHKSPKIFQRPRRL